MSQEEEIRENQHQNQSICSGAMLTLMETASSRVDSAGKHSLLDITKGFTERNFIIKIMVCSKEMTKLSKKGSFSVPTEEATQSKHGNPYQEDSRTP